MDGLDRLIKIMWCIVLFVIMLGCFILGTYALIVAKDVFEYIIAIAAYSFGGMFTYVFIWVLKKFKW